MSDKGCRVGRRLRKTQLGIRIETGVVLNNAMFLTLYEMCEMDGSNTWYHPAKRIDTLFSLTSRGFRIIRGSKHVLKSRGFKIVEDCEELRQDL